MFTSFYGNVEISKINPQMKDILKYVNIQYLKYGQYWGCDLDIEDIRKMALCNGAISWKTGQTLNADLPIQYFGNYLPYWPILAKMQNLLILSKMAKFQNFNVYHSKPNEPDGETLRVLRPPWETL